MKALLLALAVVPALAAAQAATPVPRLLPYQGRLLRTDGTPETGTQRLTFRIYDAPTSGGALWAEAQDVPLTNGFYAVFLGAAATFPDALFDGRDRWLSVAVGDGPELAPRQQIASVAYAITATHAFRSATAAQADTAARAASAATADAATTAGYAANAGHALLADTATHTTRADQATSADTAASAASVSGGTVRASTITATGDVSTSGSVIAAGAQINGNATVTGDLTILGALHAPGGGYRVLGGVYDQCNKFGLSPGDNERLNCQAWGAGNCPTLGPGWCGQGTFCAQGTAVMVSREARCWVQDQAGDGHDGCACYQYLCVEQ